MSVISRHGIYRLTVFAWALGVSGALILIVSGNAEPYVSPTQVPLDGPLELFGAAAGLILAGAFVVGRLERRSWKRAGERATLAPTGWSLVGKPDLEGTVDGHTVRARTVKRNTGGGGEEGSSRTTFTVVEADLAGRADAGLVLGPTDGSGFDAEALGVDLPMGTTTVGDVAVVGDEDLAREVVTSRVSDALDEPDRLEAVLAGNAGDVLSDAVPEQGGLVAGAIAGKMQDAVEERVPGGPGTVSTEQRGVLLDPTELERQVAAVATVAERFDRAVATGADAGRDVAPE